MRFIFSTKDFCGQVPIHANGENFFRLPFQSFNQFSPAWRCRWCCQPIWPVQTAGGEHDCDVDADRVSLFVDLTAPHACAGSRADQPESEGAGQ